MRDTRVVADLYSSWFSFFTVFLPIPRVPVRPLLLFRRSYCTSTGYPVTRMRNRLSTRGWMARAARWYTIEVVHIRARRKKKANRQWYARFRLESYQSLSWHNSTSVTCYLPALYIYNYTTRSWLYRDIIPSLSLSLSDHNGGSIDTPSIPVENAYGTIVEWVMCVCMRAWTIPRASVFSIIPLRIYKKI